MFRTGLLKHEEVRGVSARTIEWMAPSGLPVSVEAANVAGHVIDVLHSQTMRST